MDIVYIAKLFLDILKDSILTMYKNIIIHEVDLDLLFENEQDKRKYISSIANTFGIKNSDNDLKLIKSINDYRLKKI